MMFSYIVLTRLIVLRVRSNINKKSPSNFFEGDSTLKN